MKTKILLILMAMFLPLSTFLLNADSPPHKQDIPLYTVSNGDHEKNNRSLVQLPIECCYFSMMNSLVTTICSDLGDVALTVTNSSTGNVWYDTFDSALEPQTTLTFKGEPGIYQIVYITGSGGVYEGTFTSH